MNKYYLVLGQCDAYITNDWFKTLEAATRAANKAEGKEFRLETIEVAGEIKNLHFSDDDFPEPCLECGEEECECDTCGDCCETEVNCNCIETTKECYFEH